VTFGSGLIAYVFKIPAGGFLVPMIVAIFAREVGLLNIVLPPWLLAISYALFGWSIGLRFTREVLAHATRALPQLLGAIAVLIAICAGFGLILATVAGVDPLTAYLATSPGGADSVAIIAASSKVDMPFVMTMQMARFLVVTVTGPALARTLAGKFGRKSAKTDS
jgi:membrane AbrB-like protein